VVRLLVTLVPALVRIGVVVEPHELNGEPGAILRDRDGKVVNTLALDILGGRIQTIRAVLNPDKLRHLGPVADAREVLPGREPSTRAPNSTPGSHTQALTPTTPSTGYATSKAVAVARSLAAPHKAGPGQAGTTDRSEPGWAELMTEIRQRHESRSMPMRCRRVEANHKSGWLRPPFITDIGPCGPDRPRPAQPDLASPAAR